jgi:hypothetical protein
MGLHPRDEHELRESESPGYEQNQPPRLTPRQSLPAQRFLTAGLGIEFSTRRRNKFAGTIQSVEYKSNHEHELRESESPGYEQNQPPRLTPRQSLPTGARLHLLTAGLGIEFSTRRRNKFAGTIQSVEYKSNLDYNELRESESPGYEQNQPPRLTPRQSLPTGARLHPRPSTAAMATTALHGWHRGEISIQRKLGYVEAIKDSWSFILINHISVRGHQ